MKCQMPIQLGENKLEVFFISSIEKKKRLRKTRVRVMKSRVKKKRQRQATSQIHQKKKQFKQTKPVVFSAAMPLPN